MERTLIDDFALFVLTVVAMFCAFLIWIWWITLLERHMRDNLGYRHEKSSNTSFSCVYLERLAAVNRKMLTSKMQRKFYAKIKKIGISVLNWYQSSTE